MTAQTAQTYRCGHLLTPSGWLSPGYLTVDPDGMIAAVAGESPGLTARADRNSLSEAPGGASLASIDGYVVPGMPNLHSHAHQRGLAGRAEAWVAREGSTFWDWRRRMYAFVDALGPDDLEAIAAQAYLEMLRSGFTSVGEFHYLHHTPSGAPYADPAELSARVHAAARATGIALTLLPSLYVHGGFGRPPEPEQRRFLHTPEAFLDLFATLHAWQAGDPLLRVGIAPHSLRAVDLDTLAAVVEEVTRRDPAAPVHVHVAEQRREVEECLAALGRRPIACLLDRLPVNEHWTLIHATHHDEAERAGMVERGTLVGLCPTTEANLGDGLFPLAAYDRAGGAWGIGTDANLAPSVAEELRCLEYGQRLVHQRRDVLADPADPTRGDPGHLLFARALAGGARALGQPVGAIAPGRRADLVVLDPAHPALAGHGPASVLDAWLVAGGSALVRDVMVGGRWVIENGYHSQGEAIVARFRAVMDTLRDRF